MTLLLRSPAGATTQSNALSRVISWIAKDRQPMADGVVAADNGERHQENITSSKRAQFTPRQVRDSPNENDRHDLHGIQS